VETDRFHVDVSYAHLLILDAESNNINQSGAVLDGEYDLSTDVVSVGITWLF
jgi:long-subunit fatty acid transport protein